MERTVKETASHGSEQSPATFKGLYNQDDDPQLMAEIFNLSKGSKDDPFLTSLDPPPPAYYNNSRNPKRSQQHLSQDRSVLSFQYEVQQPDDQLDFKSPEMLLKQENVKLYRRHKQSIAIHRVSPAQLNILQNQQKLKISPVVQPALMLSPLKAKPSTILPSISKKKLNDSAMKVRRSSPGRGSDDHDT